MSPKIKQITHYGKQWDEFTLCGRTASMFLCGEEGVYEYWTSDKRLVDCEECLKIIKIGVTNARKR